MAEIQAPLPDLQIDPATPADLPMILRFIQGLAEYERLSDQCVATEELLGQTLFGDAPAAQILLARLSGQAVGFALYFTNYSTFLARPGIYIEDLFVEPAHRGRGVGKALLIRVAQIAQTRGYGRLEWSVLDWNAPAINFYKALGATPMNEWTIFRVTGNQLAQLAAKGAITEPPGRHKD